MILFSGVRVFYVSEDNTTRYMIQTLAHDIKRIKPIPFQKENQSSAFLKSQITRVQQGTAFSTVLFKYDATD